MENVESPKEALPMILSIRSERNVLKELNCNEGISPTTKSPKEAKFADQPEIQVKEATSFSFNSPVVDTNSDGTKKAINKNLLNVATPTDGQSDDDEFVDCNSTFRSSSSSINNNSDDLTIASDEAHTTLENQESSPNESCDVNEIVHAFNRKLNLGFIETINSVVDNLAAEKSTEQGESDSKDTTIFSSFIDDSGCTDQSSKVIVHQLIDENIHKSLGSVEKAVESASESEHVIESTQAIEAKSVESSPLTDSEQAVDTNLESSQTDKALNVTQDVLSLDNSTVGQQDSGTFISENSEVNQLVVVEASSTKSDFNIEDKESNTVTTVSKAVIEEAPTAGTDVFDPAIESNFELESPQIGKALNVTQDVLSLDSSTVGQLDGTFVSSEVNQTVVIEANSSKSDLKEESQESNTLTTEANTVIEEEPITGTVFEPVIKSNSESPQIGEALNVTQDVHTFDNSTVGQQEGTFISSNSEVNQTVVIEASSPKADFNIESQDNNTPASEAKTVIEEEPKTGTDVFDPAIESNFELESPQIGKALNVTQDVLSLDSSTVGQQDGTCVSKNSEVNQTIVIEANSSKSDFKAESQEINTLTTEAKTVIEEEPVTGTVFEPVIESNSGSQQIGKALHVTQDVLSLDNSTVGQEDGTFVSKASEVNQTVLIEANPPKSDFNIEDQENDTPTTELNAVIDGAHTTGTDVFDPTIESNLESKSPQTDKALNSTQDVHTFDNSTVGQQEGTFISSNSEVVEASSPKSDFKAESQENNTPATEAKAVIEEEPNTGTDVFDPAIESNFELEQPRIGNALNVTQDVISLDSLTAGQQDETFVSKNSEVNQTVVIEVNSPKTDEKIESQEESNTKLNQVQKISDFKTNQAFSTDSLELDSEQQDCSLDSLEMKPDEPTDRLIRKETFDLSTPFACDSSSPAINLNESVSKLSRQETFKIPAPLSALLSRKETFDVYSSLSESDSSSSVNDLTVLLNKVSLESPIGDSDRLKRCGTFEILNGDSDNQKLTSSSDGQPNAESGGSELETKISSKGELPNMVLSLNDFDFLQSRGAKTTNSEEDRRSSLLLRFDPLSGRTVSSPHLPTTVEISEPTVVIEESVRETSQQFGEVSAKENSVNESHSSDTQSAAALNAAEMSVSLIHDTNNMDSETNTYANNIKTDIAGDVPLNDKKIKFEYADENIRKKMEEYEATQEILVKRLAEKEKTLAKNCSIIEVYEKALAELVADKERLTDHHEVANERLRQERDIHHQHLMSLEITFSDLHKKYELSKDIAIQLRERLDTFTEEKGTIDGLVKQQEARYEKMKQHALHQLEYANSTLEDQEKNNSRENSRLKSLLKIEEVSRNTMQEQLTQKCKENEELVKICDELIGGGQRS